VGIVAIFIGLMPSGSRAASHREAPLISMDPTADITDFFMFRSYEPGKDDKVVLIMDVIPGEEPSSGPNYWNFDPNVVYTFSIDNNGDGKAEDIEFEIRFRNEFRGTNKALGLFLSYVALPPITKLDGAGSEGLGLRQKYSVTMIHDGKRDKLGDGLIAVPSNVGPRTMPDYPALAAQGVYRIEDGVRVFAGQREDPFYIDLGGVFDTLNLRRPAPLLTAAEDADDTTNPFGVDMLSGFNVHTIALEVPAKMLTVDGKSIGKTANPTIGAYASTSRQRTRVLRGRSAFDNDDGGSSFVQVQRLANPLVNEVIIGTEDKDRWNALEPEQESRFLDYYLNPRYALALQTVFGVPAATSGRTDLRDLLLKYKPSDKKLSELLRLNLSVDPTPLASQKRLTVLAGDNAGWPNGRRPIDDVTDVATRVVGGPNYIAGKAGDGVNTNDATLSASFPFLATPFDGRSSQHQNTP
jgi:hypothetical protein